jgi:heme-binding protein
MVTTAPRRRFTFRRLAVGFVILLGIAQLVPVERSNPPVQSDVDAPPEVRTILRGACYDCHSHETRWPWYSRVAPGSWLLASHVKEGRGDLNFSEWPVVDFEAREDAMKDIHKQIEKDKMPLRSYRWMHPDARLTDTQRATLLQWASATMSTAQ